MENNNNKQMLEQLLDNFWETTAKEIEDMEDFKTHAIPLARIKKVMKMDDEVKMISAEAPALFSKACELFILEIAHRAWMHTGASKRRTIQKSDIAMAISKSDMFDFLIDIVPREDKPKKPVDDSNAHSDFQYMYQSQNGEKDAEAGENGHLDHNGTSASTTLYSNYTNNGTDQTNLNNLLARQYSSSMYNPTSSESSQPQQHAVTIEAGTNTSTHNINTLLPESGDPNNNNVSYLDMGSFVNSSSNAST